MPLREEKIGMRGAIRENIPVDDADCEAGNGDLRKFWRNRRRGIGTGRAGKCLARLLVGRALRQFSIGRRLTEADFEEGPVLPGRVRGELRACEGTEEKLEHERIGGEPAERPPTATQYAAPQLLHIQPRFPHPSRNIVVSAMRPVFRKDVARISAFPYLLFRRERKARKKSVLLACRAGKNLSGY